MTRICAFVIAVALIACNCSADVLVTSANQKHFGLLVESKNDATEFLVFNPDSNKFESKRFDRRNVISVLITVDQNKLANLNFRNLDSIRDFAEELIGTESDQVCGVLAKRLFLLLIYHAEASNESHQRLVKSACRNLIKLADSDQELDLFQKIGVVFGGLDFPTQKHLALPKQKHDSKKLLDLIRLLRTSQFEPAHKLLNQLRKANRVPRDIEELAIRIFAIRKVDDLLLKKMLSAEIGLLNPDSKSIEKKTIKWLANQPIGPNVGLIRLENVIPFDFKATKFENGKWVRPPNQ